MKRVKFLVILILSLLLGSTTVCAEDEDVWKPDEPFFTEHAEECVVMGREYYANGPNGQVIIYESPASSKEVKTLENGETILIDYVYTNDKGVEWGFCEYAGEFGWLPMPYMVVVYDYISFAEDYAEQIQEERGTAIKTEDAMFDFFSGSRKIRFWTYPGSSSKYTVKAPWGFQQNIPEYTKTFVDEDGRKWGLVTYYQGDIPNRWIIIDNAEELVADFEELYPDGAPKRDTRVIEPYSGEEIFPDDYEHVQLMQKVKTIAIASGIALVVVIAVVFYWKMWKKVIQA